MAKLYIFAIGGTGSRVLKSLTMLLASGVKINTTQIVPIIIDPDVGNGDLSRTINILREYQQIHSKLTFSSSDNNHFFEVPITSVTNNFMLKLNNVENKKFRHFIGYASLDQNNMALTNLLFSRQNLDADMDVGFKGNPNIGSIVLNQFKNSADYQTFAAGFAPGDRIFIISSIFGGTGASGFPLLVKNIRAPQNNLTTSALLRNAVIGAVTVLPYFGVKNNADSSIDKGTFIAKTKAALNYYKDNLSGNDSINALYYIGGDLSKDQENNEGSIGQRNEAHFIELASAMAIVDFMNDATLTTAEGKAVKPLYKEYGLQNETASIEFKDLGPRSNQMITTQLTQYALFCLYLKNHLGANLHLKWAAEKKGIKIDNAFVMAPFYSTYLSGFNAHFEEWLAEMRNNEVAFAPLNMGVGNKNLFDLVVGQKARSSISFARNYDYIDKCLNKASDICASVNAEQRFMDMFYMATKKVVEAKY